MNLTEYLQDKLVDVEKAPVLFSLLELAIIEDMYLSKFTGLLIGLNTYQNLDIELVFGKDNLPFLMVSPKC